MPEDKVEQKKGSKKLHKRKKKKKIFRILRLLFCVLLVAALVVGLVLLFKFGPQIMAYQEEARTQVRQSSEEDFRISDTSYIYDSKGEQLAKLKTDKDISYIEFEDLPDEVLDAIIAIEDKRFYSHSGVDWLSTAKAVYLLVANDGGVTRGGSTITQQLARNKYLTFEVSFERKMREIFFALELERKYSKKEVFEFYINNINFSNGYYGIGSAAKGYFGKEVAELSIAEIAFLCAIPNNPTYYNPRSEFDHTVTRQNTILEQMFEQDYISEQAYTEGKQEEIKLVEAENPFYNYESSYAIACAVKYLMEKGGFQFRYDFQSNSDYNAYLDQYNEAYSDAKEKLYSGGYKIYTSIDKQVQLKLQESIDAALVDFQETTEDGIYKYQAAGTVIDNATGEVIAIVGGRTQESESEGVMTLNRAFQSYRQPGSTIKPLLVYTPALENGYSDNSIVEDTPIEDGPKNSDNSYSGNITLRTAVEKSKNVVAWRLFEELTPARGLSYLQNMQFDKIVPDDYVLPSSLGGMTYGVTTVQMAGGFRTLANDGGYREPTCITRFLTAEGEDIWEGRPEKSIYDSDATRVMTDILQGVALEGTARGLSLSNDMPLACKTGTTNEQTCGWFCGYTPYYTMAAYVGADTNVPMSGLWGGTYPKDIWQMVQEYLSEEKEPIPFATSENIHEEYEPEYVPEVPEVEEPLPEDVIDEVIPEELPKPDETDADDDAANEKPEDSEEGREPQDEDPQDEDPQDEEPQDEEPQDEKPQDEDGADDGQDNEPPEDSDDQDGAGAPGTAEPPEEPVEPPADDAAGDTQNNGI